MSQVKQSSHNGSRSYVLYVALYITSLTVCFVGGYFLGLNRAIKIWIHQQDQKLLDKEQQVYLQKNDAIQQNFPIQLSCTSTTQQPTGYRAFLIGGTKKVVESFVDAMKQRNIFLDIQERISKTSKGKKYYWYQATTPIIENKEELQKLVEVLKKYGKLKDVKIVQYS